MPLLVLFCHTQMSPVFDCQELVIGFTYMKLYSYLEDNVA